MVDRGGAVDEPECLERLLFGAVVQIDDKVMCHKPELFQAPTVGALVGRAAALAEAREQPELLREAPVTTPVRRLDEARAARALKLPAISSTGSTYR